MIVKNRKAAMEMSVGTIVTIVLLMSVLVLGIFLVQKIFKSSTNAIDLTDAQLMNELNKLFSSGEDQKIIIFPQTGEINAKKGESGAVGILINNRIEEEETFSYETTLADKGSCSMTESQLENLIDLGGSRDNIKLGSGDKSNALRIVFKIPETAKICNVMYQVDVSTSNDEIYDSTDIILNIK